jgi:trimeric autotransporter adhesin
MKKLLTSVAIVLAFAASAQEGIGINTNTPEASSALDITSTSKGILIPRMTQEQRIAINPASTAKGLLVFQTDNDSGFYYYNGTEWAALAAGGGDFVDLTSEQTIGGTKNFSNNLTVNGLEIGAYNAVYEGSEFSSVLIGKDVIIEDGTVASVVIGSSTSGEIGSTVVGFFAGATTDGVAIGSGANSAAENAVAIGTASVVRGVNSMALGNHSSALRDNSAAIGYGSVATAENSVALGKNASVTQDASTNSMALGANSYVDTSNTIQLGNTEITSVKTSGKLTTGAVTYPNTHNSKAGQILTTDAFGVATWQSPTVPNGLNSGDMLYWDGVAWVTIDKPADVNVYQLIFVAGKPQWMLIQN